MATIQTALTEGKRLLRGPGKNVSACITSPSLDASLLLAHALNTTRGRLVSTGNETIPDDGYSVFLRLIERRLSGECVAYILGKKEFRGLDFTVSPAVLVPRPDTEILVETALAGIDGSPPPVTVLDLCTGSGAAAIALKHERPAAGITASDISEAALEIAETNAARLLGNAGAGADARAFHITFIKSDLFENIPGKFNLITANPPYIPSGEIDGLAPEVRREPRMALDGGKDGLALIRRIIAEARRHLFPGGSLLLEIDPREAPAVRNLLEKAGFNDIQSYRDLAGFERVMGGSMTEQHGSFSIYGKN
ncbi:MAG: peptide chain release factor N(5)-glutamine methyltransferase [Treponema sp.]|jgi:release factor glutamine methyltransferase|nr:peptide chain release factor N(5)-glutamine methyltransferase [Treponema sp.]